MTGVERLGPNVNALIVTKWLIELKTSLPFAILTDGELGSRNELAVLVHPQRLCY